MTCRDEDYLILSTMHSAKGLEWDAVYVPQRYYFHGYGRSYAQPSRFLSAPVRACFACRAAERDPETVDAPVATVTSADICKQVRALWA